jgi:hypothetical protein
MTSAREKALQPGRPDIRSLRHAQEWLIRRWPGDCSTAAALLAYHRMAADLYDRVASADPAHHHEALFWAQQERATAQALAELITPRRPVDP